DGGCWKRPCSLHSTVGNLAWPIGQGGDMADTSQSRVSIAKLIFIPSLITLAVTVLRLVGELEHWNTKLFNPAPGGPGSIIGITWLVLVFGVYFALKLARTGETPPSAGRVIGYALLGLVVVFAGGFVGFGLQA